MKILLIIITLFTLAACSREQYSEGKIHTYRVCPQTFDPGTNEFYDLGYVKTFTSQESFLENDVVWGYTLDSGEVKAGWLKILSYVTPDDHEFSFTKHLVGISDRIEAIYGGGDLGLIMESYLMEGLFTDQMGYVITYEEWEKLTGIQLEVLQ